jgi:hypothetical protein
MERRLEDVNDELSSGDLVYRQRGHEWSAIGVVVGLDDVGVTSTDDRWLFVGQSHVCLLGDVVHRPDGSPFAIQPTSEPAADEIVHALRLNSDLSDLPAAREIVTETVAVSGVLGGLRDPSPDDLWVIRRTCPAHGLPEPCKAPPPHMI